MARITLLGRPGCHLCDDARVVIERVAEDLGVGWEERDITASPEDMVEYWDKIPVTLVDGVQIDFWRISESRLREALARPRGILHFYAQLVPLRAVWDERILR